MNTVILDREAIVTDEFSEKKISLAEEFERTAPDAALKIRPFGSVDMWKIRGSRFARTGFEIFSP